MENNIERLIEIMDLLREKCPWDKKQTILSLRNNTIEETFELADAIMAEDFDQIREELGDLLLHIVFYSKIASEEGHFTIDDVARTINEKLIYRHPHVFGDVVAQTEGEVIKNWEALKQKKRTQGGAMSGVPRGMPALPKALRIGQKAAAVGFEWEDRKEVWGKIKEEIHEFETEIEVLDQKNMEAEFGDILFSLVNVARMYNIDPEAALERTNLKFLQRFNFIEHALSEKGISIEGATLEQMDALWEQAKGCGSRTKY